MGFLFGGFSSQKSKSTNQQSGTQSGTQTQNLNAPQSDALTSVSSLIQSLLSNPTKSLDPLKQQADNSTNASYTSTLPTLREAMLSAGGDASGKFGNAVAASNQARIGKLADNNTNFANMALQQQNLGSSLAMQLLNHVFSQSTTGDYNSSGSGTGSQSGFNAGFNSSQIKF